MAPERITNWLETAQPTLMSVTNIPFQVRYQYEDNLGDRRLKAILNETVVDGVSHPVDAFTFTTSPEGLILSRTENDGSADGPPYGWHHGWQHGNGAADGVPGSSHPNQGKSEGHGKGTDNGHTNGRWAESDGITTQFGHDGALRLTQATGGTTESYVYDPASNLTQLTDASISQSITVNPLNEIQSANGVPYLYDANGNLLDDGMRTYTWDAADRLLSITDKATGHVSGFVYDGLSRRVQETETETSAVTSEVHLLWCGQALCEKRGAGDSVLARFFPEGEWRPGQPLLYARDQVGSAVAVVDTSGGVAGRLRYSSYGSLTDSEGVLPDFRYAGLVHHQPSGLELATYRAYAAKVGRWISRDPAREFGGTSLFGYAGDNPRQLTDQTGLILVAGDYEAEGLIAALALRPGGIELLSYLDSSPAEYTVFGDAPPPEGVGVGALGITGNAPGEHWNEGARLYSGSRTNGLSSSAACGFAMSGANIRLFAFGRIDPVVNLAHELSHAAMYDAYTHGERSGYPLWLEHYRVDPFVPVGISDPLSHLLFTGEINQQFGAP